MAVRRAYATLVTRSSYLAGAIILAYTIQKHGSQYPLIVLYTSTLSDDAVRALELEAERTNINPRKVEALLPTTKEPINLIAERFADTWTKLRVFEIFDYDEVCYLDADMTIRKNMDLVFEEAKEAHNPVMSRTALGESFSETSSELTASSGSKVDRRHEPVPAKGDAKAGEALSLTGRGQNKESSDAVNSMSESTAAPADTATLGEDWLGAAHTCCCNLDHDSWAPPDWIPENCPYTPLSHPSALRQATQSTPSSPATYHLLNGGLFLFNPSKDLWSRMYSHFSSLATSGRLATFKFPDQDFLADFFKDRWTPLPWKFNALKTWRYWHPGFWRDEEVVCLHYIVDKPWARRIREDGVAGYKGKDGKTHGWWWKEYEEWVKSREVAGLENVVRLVSEHVAGSDGVESAEMRAIGGGAQDFAKTGKDHRNADGEEKKPTFDSNVSGDVTDGETNGKPAEERPKDGTSNLLEGESAWKHKLLGERGHGPVVQS